MVPPVSGIINQMNAALTADGYPRSKEKLIQQRFPLTITARIGTPDTLIQLRTVIRERCFKTPALTLSDMRSNMAAKKKDRLWPHHIRRTSGLLMLAWFGFCIFKHSSFGERDLKLSKQHFKPFIDRFFGTSSIPLLTCAPIGGEDGPASTCLPGWPMFLAALTYKITSKPSFWKHTNKPFMLKHGLRLHFKTDSGLFVTRKNYFRILNLLQMVIGAGLRSGKRAKPVRRLLPVLCHGAIGR